MTTVANPTGTVPCQPACHLKAITPTPHAPAWQAHFCRYVVNAAELLKNNPGVVQLRQAAFSLRMAINYADVVELDAQRRQDRNQAAKALNYIIANGAIELALRPAPIIAE